MKLSDAQVAQYEDRGYLCLKGYLPPAMLEELRRVTDALTAASAAVTASDDVYDVDSDHRADRIRLRRIKLPLQVHASYRDAFTGPHVLDTIQSLLGPDIRQFGGKINMKLAGSAEAIEWHQDFAYHPHTNDDILAMGVLLDDCGPENGPLLVVPGSHRGPLLSHEGDDGVFCGAIDPLGLPFDPAEAVAITGPAGTISLHHGRLIHGSAANTSARPRRMMFIPYARADAWPLTGVPWAAYSREIVRGRPCKTPRLEAVPVRLPYPKPPEAGSIFEIQQSASRHFFETPKAKVAETA